MPRSSSIGELDRTSDRSIADLGTTAGQSSIRFLFDQDIEPQNLKEKFLYATFAIVAERGADSLTASELIRRTNSSKGALFHHFSTIDNLCIESLHYFREHLNRMAAVDDCTSLEDYIAFQLEKKLRRQANKSYLHLANFYRDRALRDERYLEPLRQIFEVNLNRMTDRVAQFLSPSVNRQAVYQKVLFFSLAVERLGTHRALYKDP